MTVTIGRRELMVGLGGAAAAWPARRARTAADDGCFDYGVAPLGRRTVNTEPLPGSLVTVTSPPIMRASFNGPDPFT
jgi:hypothetical protein